MPNPVLWLSEIGCGKGKFYLARNDEVVPVNLRRLKMRWLFILQIRRRVEGEVFW